MPLWHGCIQCGQNAYSGLYIPMVYVAGMLIALICLKVVWGLNGSKRIFRKGIGLWLRYIEVLEYFQVELIMSSQQILTWQQSAHILSA